MPAPDPHYATADALVDAWLRDCGALDWGITDEMRLRAMIAGALQRVVVHGVSHGTETPS